MTLPHSRRTRAWRFLPPVLALVVVAGAVVGWAAPRTSEASASALATSTSREPSPEGQRPGPVKGPRPTVVSLTFDDGYGSQRAAAQMLTDRGVPATFYLNSGLLDTTPYAAPSWVAELVEKGHEVGGHTTTHVDLVDMPAADRRAAICRDRRMLEALGASPTTFAYPFGAYDDEVVADVQACGYRSARASSGLRVGDRSCTSCPHAESLFPIDHRFNIRTPSTVRADDDWRDLARLVRAAERTGGWVPLVMHRVCDGCAEESVSLETIDAFTTWLTTRPRQTVVLPVGTVVEEIDATGSVPLRASAGRDRASGGGAGLHVVHVLGVPVGQLALLGGGLLLMTALLLGHRLATRSRRYR